MLKPLRSNRRRSLLRGSLLSLAGAVAVWPLAFPPALPAAAGAGLALPAIRVPSISETDAPEPAVARDPFVPEAPAETAATTAIVVEAVALGSSPRALVRTGESSRIVGVGDALGDSSVGAIDARGVLLENGESLPLAVPR